ncbi:MAG: DUF262 domain-containing protein [Gammaproteobacteria bacterium]|nr:DUF262 domain-containing protein [Gammaproteobacteria bacterium]
MNPLSKPDTNIVVVDGDAAIVMRFLRNHSGLSHDRLNELACRELETDERFEAVLTYVGQKQWIQRSGDNVRLTEQGEAWLDKHGGELTVEEEDPGSDDTPKQPYDVAKLKMEPKHLSVFQALRKIEKKQIFLNPEFQRAFVWDEIKQSRLIESILIRIPLPAFYLGATNQEHWTVVDGLQRLTTLYRYCREQTFPLSGLQFLENLNGKHFDELPPQYKVVIEDDTNLLFYNLMPGTPIEAKFTIFSRVNTGGMQLTAQEIRHALCQGNITELLGRLSKNKTLRIATDGVIESLRMSDRELILRALAFMHLGVDGYKQFSELDAFLLHTMDELNTLPGIKLRKLKAAFINSLKKVEVVFGKYAFRKFYEKGGRRGPLNKALFEAWTVCVRDYGQDVLKSNKDKLMDGFITLLQEKDFIDSISSGTSKYHAVSTRFSKIEQLLEETCR